MPRLSAARLSAWAISGALSIERTVKIENNSFRPIPTAHFSFSALFQFGCRLAGLIFGSSSPLA